MWETMHSSDWEGEEPYLLGTGEQVNIILSTRTPGKPDIRYES